MVEIIAYDSGWKADKICIEHSNDSFQVFLVLKLKDDVKNFWLKNVKDVSSLGELMNSHNIEISENDSDQLEYGRFKLGFSQESYFEIYFDQLEEIKS